MHCTPSALLLALSHAGSDPMICTLSNLGTVSAASRDYTKYKEELFSLHTHDAPATFPPIQSASVNNATPKLLLLRWNVDSSGLQSKAVLSLHGNNDIITLGAKFGKFHCVWMSRVVRNKVADELKLKNLGQICL